MMQNEEEAVSLPADKPPPWEMGKFCFYIIFGWQKFIPYLCNPKNFRLQNSLCHGELLRTTT